MTPSSSGEELATRYIVGIDLGTTNSAVCFIDTERDAERIETFLVPQLTMPGQVEPLETLPSFHLQPAAGVATDSSMRLPWQRRPAPYVVGVMARDEGALQPGRQIGSAKSWLSHAAVDRTAAILPWHGDADVQRLSPIEVSARYLQHIREAWDWAHPNDRLADQEIVLTLPASFDEVARELTIQADFPASY